MSGIKIDVRSRPGEKKSAGRLREWHREWTWQPQFWGFLNSVTSALSFYYISCRICEYTEILPLLLFLCQGDLYLYYNLQSTLLCYCLEWSPTRQTLELRAQGMGFHLLFYSICIWNGRRDMSVPKPKFFHSMTVHKPQHKYAHGQQISKKYYLR